MTRTQVTATRAIAYLRVSTSDQLAGLEAQRQRVEEECARRGWMVVSTKVDQGVSGRAKVRPARAEAVAILDAGGADVLVSAKFDRLTRSVVDFGKLVERSAAKGWGMVVLDFDLDTTTAAGRLAAGIIAQVAQFEAERIAERTSEVLAVKRAEGIYTGRPSRIPPAVERRIRREREAGASLRKIAAALTDDAIPTPEGRSWHASSVAAVLRRPPRKEPTE